MATLIQSKQIEGIVTASVVTGEFLISGSLVVTGSQSLLGSVTASAITSSFSGDGSGLTGITYSQIGNTPQFVGGNNITITSSSNVITVHAQLDGTGSDAQSLSINGDQLTILGGNTITIPTGSTSWEQLQNTPSGLVSSSVQILGGSGILSGSKTDISSLNTFSSSIQSEVDSLTAATSSYLTSSGSVDFSDVTNKPSGLVSSSTQITITESQISDLTHYTDSDVRTYIDSIGVVSGSYVESLPQGLISGSTFTDYSSSIQTELSEVRNDLINQFTNADSSLQSSITSLESYTSSIQSEVDSLTSATSSYITEIPQGTISGSQQVIDSLPSGVVSGSSQITISSSQITDLAHTQIPAGTISGSEQLPQGLISSSTQITITESQISDLTHYTDSDVQSYIDSIGIVSGSVVAELPSGVISGSEQLPSGLISGSTQVLDSLPSGLISGSTFTDFSSSITQDVANFSTTLNTRIDGVEQITVNRLDNIESYTSSIQSEVDSLTAATSSYLTSIDSGIVSSSAQVTELLPSGVVSGSSQITITESQISDLSHTDISSLNTFTSSIQTQVDGLSSATSSYLTSSGSVDFSDITSLPSGLVSGSTQITNGSGILSGSLIDQLPSGIVSGSTQITNGSELISSSQQVIDHLPSGVVSGSFSGSVANAIDLLNEVSGANYIESESVDSRLDTIEGSIGMYYDLSNTVWNQKYIKSGSNQASDTAGFQTGNVPFIFRLNTDRKLHYQVGDIVYINNFDRDTTITALVSSSYDTGSREVGFNVVSVNQQTGSYRINDSYWIISRHTAGFVDSASYTEASASFDHRIDVIVASGSGADWDVNLTHIPNGIVSSSEQQYTASIENGFALTSSLDNVSSSLAQRIENVYLSSSNFDAKSLVSGSEQIDLRNVTNYVGDEHIDHTTVNINAGDGLDGGGDISSTREIRLNVTSSHFTSGVGDVLTSEGVVKQSTLDDDIVGTDFSQSVDNRINAISAGSVPSGTVSGSTQIDITQTQNYTAVSQSIYEAAQSGSGGTSDFTQLTNVPSGLVSSSIQILGGSGILSGSHPIGNLNQFTASYYVDSASFDSRISDIIETGSVIAPFAFARVATISNGSGSGISWGNYNSGNGSLDFTFDSAQPDTNYIVVTDAETFDDYHVGINSKTVNGFTAEFYDSSGTRLPSSFSPFSLIVYGSTPTQTVRVNVTGAPEGTVSGSSQITLSDTDGFTSYSASVQTTIDNIVHTSIPSGTVSGSTQIDITQTQNFTSFSSSIATSIAGVSGETTDISHLNTFTSSVQSQVDELIISSSTFLTSETDSQTLSIVGDQLTISDGNTITIPTGSGQSIDTGSFATTGSNTFSGSQFITGSIIPEATSGGNGLHDLGSTSNPFRELYVTTGSVQFVKDGSVISRVSGEDNAIRVGNILITTSSIEVVNNTGQIVKQLVQSKKTSESNVDADIVLPDGLISGSLIAGTNITIDSSSGDFVISSTASGSSGSADVSFDGDRVITNTLLGDLYSQSFNAGTDGTVQDFLNALFFPSYAPTATFSTQTSNLNTNLGTQNGVIETFTLTDEDDNTPYSVTISGTDASSFVLVPQNAESSSWEIQAATDLSAGTYTYDLTITDSNGDSVDYNGRSVTISQSDTGTLSTTGTLYIIESATTGPIYLGTNGRGGSQGGVSVSYSPNYGSQVATNFQSSNPLISVNSTSGLLSVGSPISGSGNVSGDTITSTISWTDQYGNTDSSDININVTQNNAPDITFTNSSRLNTNQAVSGGGTLVTISFNDTESDSINYDSFQFTDASGQLTTTKSGGNYLVTANSDLSGSTTYTISATIEDVHGFRSNTESHSFTITQASNGTLTGDTTMYIIESAVSGDSFRDATGFGNGNVADVNVTYSPSAGSQVVQSFNSTNPAIQIDSSGNMSLGVDLSGSVTQSGDTISTTITFQDQYGNIGSGSVTANIFGNNAPAASFVSASSYDTDTATNGSTAGTITISDTESNSPYIVTLGGTDGAKFNAVPQNSVSSSWLVQPTASISTANTFSLDITVTDNYGEAVTLSNESIIVDEVSAGGTVYVYTLPIDGSYNNVTGITSAGSGTPPTPTIATSYGFFTSFVDNDTLGDSTITVSYGSNFTATLRGSASGNNVDTVLDDLGALTIGGSPASERVFVFIPSGSEMSGVPTSLSTADPGGSSTSGEYVVFVSPDGTFQNSSAGLSNDIKSANIHKLTLDTAVDGYTDWIVIGTEDRFNNANAYVRIVPSSGSVPS